MRGSATFGGIRATRRSFGRGGVILALLLAVGLGGCSSSDDDSGSSTDGAPIAGMAQGYADYPVGAPLGGYTARCRCFGGSGRVDARRSPYVTLFNPSAGVQTQPKIVALWLENGIEQLVMIKTDEIYTFEKVVTAVEARLTAATGHDMTGRVTISSNHSHGAPANYDQGITWYLGGDKFNREIFERAVTSIADVAIAAWNARQPAAIGIGQAKNWDPHDRVYSDRRGDNDGLQFFPDIPKGSYKDPNLTVIRVDTAAGEPIGMFFAFAMHGTIGSEDNEMWTVDAPGHVEAAVEDRFDKPMIVGFMQHGGGDASPRGVDDLFARMESVGEFAADAIVDLWAHTLTSTQPIHLESVTRSIDDRRDSLRVHRDYATLQYSPYSPDPAFRPDDIVYDDQGRLRSPIDEFNTEYGGAFCGAEDRPLPGQNITSNVFPYSSCGEVGALSGLIGQIFQTGEVEKPLPESLRAKTTAVRMGPMKIHSPDGSDVTDDVLFGFFPGETSSIYAEQFRRRAAAELGMPHAIPIGYSQDHQGYLLVPEDWVLGGYEPSINIWGPLQAEHIMEGLLSAASEVLTTTALEPRDPPGAYPDPVYPDAALSQLAPDLTPDAGTALAQLPAYIYVPLSGLTPAAAPAASVRRVQDVVQFAWEGGDTGVDLPSVHIERRRSDGTWEEHLTASGRPVTSAMHDILLTTTPNPLSNFTVQQHHYWWVGWQAIPHVVDKAGLPTGTYRFHVYGKKYAGGATTWPWPTAPYEVASSTFEVVPAEVSVTLNGSTLRAWIDAPASGFRLVDLEGDSRGANPVRGGTVAAILADGSRRAVSVSGEAVSGHRTQWTIDPAGLAGATAIEVTDEFGNSGELAL